MALQLLYQGETTEKNAEGTITTISYSGTKAECDEARNSAVINSTVVGLGRLVNAGVDQMEGPIYRVTFKYNSAGYATGQSVTAPSTVVGEKSATMNCSMISTPLEQHPNYLMKWNHYLAARYKSGQSTPTIPAWWATAGVAFTIPVADQLNFRILDSRGELPSGFDSEGYAWVEIDKPLMPGVSSYDVASYTQTEKARYRNFADACAAIAARANKIFTSSQIVNNGFTGGNWKCDGATIEWDNEYWIATTTYTFSANASGWNTTLYSAYSSGS